VTAAGGESLTETGLAVGTPAYMSPEQATGTTHVDARSDVYSLGCVLYEMLGGEPPYTGPSAQAILARKSLEAVPPLHHIRDTVPPDLEQTVTRALAKTPADRFATASQFAEALSSVPVGLEVGGAVSDRRRLPRRRAVVGLVGVVAVGVLATVVVRWPAEPAYERTSIAVLPFQNLSAEEQYAPFAGGLHAEVITQLSKVAALNPISRTSVMGYAGPNTPPLRQIASELEVGSVVEASVQVVGGRLRVNVQLIDVPTDAPLWAEEYARTLDDAFAIQSDIAREIVAAVGAALSSAEQQRLAEAPTTNVEAYRLYLRGREYQTRPGLLRPNLEIAHQLYERALALDPEFALARAAASVVHGFMHWYRYDPSLARMARQREEAEAALRLAPDLPQAHAAMGLLHYFGRRDYSRALDEYAIALKGLPNDAQLWALIGYAHRQLGDWDEVLAAFEEATELDPINGELFTNLGGLSYWVMHRYAEAVRAFDQALSLAPDLHYAAVMKGRAYVHWQGQRDTLWAIVRRLPRDADLGPLGTIAAQQAKLLLWDRKPDSLLELLAMEPPLSVLVGIEFFLPTSLYAAWAHQWRGDSLAAHAAFDSARILLDSLVGQLPDDWRVHAARGLALAGLDLRDEALEEAKWLQESDWYRENAYWGPFLMEDRARILAQVGEADSALNEIERLLAGASWLSVHTLRLEPLWDPLRDDPRFQALLEQYAEPRQQ
jgi:TolB-like protein/lipoprotein NlpI